MISIWTHTTSETGRPFNYKIQGEITSIIVGCAFSFVIDWYRRFYRSTVDRTSCNEE